VNISEPRRGDTRSGTAGRRELFARHEVQQNEHLHKSGGWGGRAWGSRIDVRRQAAYVLQVLR